VTYGTYGIRPDPDPQNRKKQFIDLQCVKYQECSRLGDCEDPEETQLEVVMSPAILVSICNAFSFS
jgi:hypothetical protein